MNCVSATSYSVMMDALPHSTTSSNISFHKRVTLSGGRTLVGLGIDGGPTTTLANLRAGGGGGAALKGMDVFTSGIGVFTPVDAVATDPRGGGIRAAVVEYVELDAMSVGYCTARMFCSSWLLVGTSFLRSQTGGGLVGRGYCGGGGICRLPKRVGSCIDVCTLRTSRLYSSTAPSLGM